MPSPKLVVVAVGAVPALYTSFKIYALDVQMASAVPTPSPGRRKLRSCPAMSIGPKLFAPVAHLFVHASPISCAPEIPWPQVGTRETSQRSRPPPLVCVPESLWPQWWPER